MQQFCDGFDHYGYDSAGRAVMIAGAWETVHATLAFPSLGPAVGPRTGIGCLECRTVNTADTLLAQHEITSLFEVFTSQALYLTELPNHNNAVRFMQYISFDSDVTATVSVTVEGNIALRAGESGTLLATTTIPPLVAGKWYAIEMRFVQDEVDGIFAVRVREEGEPFGKTATVLAVTGINTANGTTDPVILLGVKTGDATAEQVFYLDDWIVRDATGDFNNNFMGPLHVGTMHPNADTEQHGWSRFGTATDWEAVAKLEPDDTSYLIASAAAFDFLTFTGRPRNGETVTLGAKTYTFKTVMTTANDVQILSTLADCIVNLAAAINDNGDEGTQYGTGTTANAQARAEVYSTSQMLAVALTAGTAGNSVVSTDTVRYASWSGATLSGGATLPEDTELVLPDPLEEMKKILSVTIDNRAYKMDADDFTQRVSFVGPKGNIANGTNADPSTTPRHRRDLFETDPDTAGALTRTTLFGARVHLDRTV